MIPDITLTTVTRDDIARIGGWLEDDEVSRYWFGKDEANKPLHIGYSPQNMLQSDNQEWAKIFLDDNRLISSIYDANETHIGEIQVVFEHVLHEAQVFLIIGKKELWQHHFGSASLMKLLDYLFHECGLHRVWVDVPLYNIHAAHMCQRLGFVLEGRLRSTHPKDGGWYDSSIMGMLESEYARRRPKLLDMLKQPSSSQ